MVPGPLEGSGGRQSVSRTTGDVRQGTGAAAVQPSFVGRETQLHALVSAVEAAELGESVVAVVGGEPGIGKTRLVREVAARVASPVLWSSCWEGDGAPPYWPWQQLFRALLTANDAERLRAAAQHDGEELRRLLGQADAPDTSDGGRFRLFDAVVQVFAAAAQIRPLVLVLDDLHWADEPSIRLLQFFEHDPRVGRLAIIGTYRDSDLDDAHPLASCLGDLTRRGLHLCLGGLGARDVGLLAGAVSGESAPSSRTVSLLHRRTGGNPLFVRELVRLLEAEGSLETFPESSGAAVPTSVRAVVTQRLGRLSPSTQEVLAAASVIGPDFDVATLASVVDLSRDAVLAAVDEAASARLLRRTADRTQFGFSHALVREVLYDGLGLAVRTRLHRRMAALLEERRSDDRLSELAHHLLQAAVDGEDRERAVVSAERSGSYSLQLLAYEEAAAWFARALDLLRADGGDDARQAGLLLELGEASLAAGDVPRARDAYQQAAAIARVHGDAELLAKAALGLGTGFGGFEVRLLDPVQVQLLEDALHDLGTEPSALRTWVLARLSVALSFLETEARRRALSEEAVAMGRAIDDRRALGYALAGHCDVIAGPDSCEIRLHEAEEVVRLGREVGDRQLELLGRRLRLVALLEVGDVGEADAEVTRFAQVADGLRQPLYRWYVPLWTGMRALMRGDLDEAARERAQAEELGALAHSGNAIVLTFTQWWVQQRMEGHFAEAGTAMADLLGQHDVPGEPATTRAHAVVATLLGEHEKARVLLHQWRSAGLHERTRDSEWLPESAQLAQAAVLAGAREEAEILYAQLRPYAHRFCIEGVGAAFTGSVAWYLGLLARFLGHDADAERYEAEALAAHRRVGLVTDPPPLAAPRSAHHEPSPTAGSASMCHEGATWAVSYAGRTVRLRDSKGLRDLALLLSRPDEDIHCLELMGGADTGSEAGPALDQQARRAYERRIRELQADIDDARDANDPVRAERAEGELDALVQQLAQAFGLAGRSRATGSATERARSAASWRIRAAVRQAAEVHGELGRHLQNAIRTGTWCSYRPETPIRWEVDDRQGRRA